MLDRLRGWWKLKKMQMFLLRSKKIKIIVGAGETEFDGWLETDVDTLDITDASKWQRLLGKKKIDNILAEHVLEHLTEDKIEKTLVNAAKFLKTGGIFRIAVPDGYHASKYVVDLVKPNGLEPRAEDHKVLLNIDKLSRIAQKSGLLIKPIEYFDKQGVFHNEKWDVADGYIGRSYKYYKGRFTNDKKEYLKFIESVPEPLRSQFIDKKMSYTSLFVDLVKS